MTQPAGRVRAREKSLKTTCFAFRDGSSQSVICFLHISGQLFLYLPPSPPSIAVLARGIFHPPPTPLSLRFLSYPQGVIRALQRSPLQRRLSPSALLSRRALYRISLQGEYAAVITDPAASAPSPPGNPAPLNVLPPSGRISSRTRRRTAAAAGTTPPADDYDFGLRGASRPSVQRAIAPP